MIMTTELIPSTQERHTRQTGQTGCDIITLTLHKTYIMDNEYLMHAVLETRTTFS